MGDPGDEFSSSGDSVVKMTETSSQYFKFQSIMSSALVWEQFEIVTFDSLYVIFAQSLHNSRAARRRNYLAQI